MTKYTSIKIIYDAPPFPPEGIQLNRVYSIIKKDKTLYIVDGKKEIEISEDLIKMLFVPNDKKLTWADVDFSDEKVVLTTNPSKLSK